MPSAKPKDGTAALQDRLPFAPARAFGVEIQSGQLVQELSNALTNGTTTALLTAARTKAAKMVGKDPKGVSCSTKTVTLEMSTLWKSCISGVVFTNLKLYSYDIACIIDNISFNVLLHNMSCITCCI